MEKICNRVYRLSRILIYSYLKYKSLFLPRRTVSVTDFAAVKRLCAQVDKKHPLTINFPFLLFQAEMSRARIVGDPQLLKTVVHLYSRVTVQVAENSRILHLQLVRPSEEDLREFKLSILSALGMALFAKSQGQTLSYHKRRLKILQVA